MRAHLVPNRNGLHRGLVDGGPQSKDSASTGSGYDRGHLAQREAFKAGTAEALRAADHFTNVVPMRPELTRAVEWPDGNSVPSDWIKLEMRAVKELTPKYGYVTVEVEPIVRAR